MSYTTTINPTMTRFHHSWLLVGLVALLESYTNGFSNSAPFLTRVPQNKLPTTSRAAEPQAQGGAAAPNDSAAPTAQSPAPTLNGKRVLPFKILAAGLKGSQTPAVYAVLNASFKRGSEGWDATEYVGVSQDLDASLQAHWEQHGAEKVAHIRALSFTYPQPNAMQDVAISWREMARSAGATITGESQWLNDAMVYLLDEDDEDDDDDDDEDDQAWSMEMTAQAMGSVAAADSTGTVVSPFDQSNTDSKVTTATDIVLPSNGGPALVFTPANVDKVLDEVRPYLIADGGNVAVERVDETTKNVYLKLEGACGSCASSTVTMQMGIERTLRENFPDLGQVLQVEDDPASKPTELTMEAVEDEVNRLKPAIIAMGCIVEILSVDPIGVVKMKFRGANRVQGGLQLALLDVPFVKHVEFTMGEE